MRELWSGVRLPVLILIEVILMSHNGEGANTSAAKHWSKRDTRNAGNVWSSDFIPDQSSEVSDKDSSNTIGRNKRSGIGKTGRTVDKNLQTNTKLLWPLNDDETSLRSNDPGSSLDSENLEKPSLSRIIESLSGREVENRPESSSVQLQENRSAITYVLEKVLSILCHIIRRMILQLEPYSSVSKMILRIVLQFINMVKHFIIGEDHSNPAEPPRGTIQKLIDYFNPLKQTEAPKYPPQQIKEEKGVIGSLIDYINPFKKSTDPQHLNEPLDETLAVLETVVNILRPLKSGREERDDSQSVDKGWVRAMVNGLGNSETAQSARSQHLDVFPKANSLEDNPFDLLASLIMQPPTNSPPSTYNRRRTREANACPKLPRNYHKAAGVGRAYKLHISNQNWENARLKCKTESAELAMPENQQQYDVMVDHAKRVLGSPESRFHIGLHRLLHWTTVNGDPPSFEKWANRDADQNPTEKRCGAMIVSDNVDGFNGELCSIQLPFMCEMIIPAECA